MWYAINPVHVYFRKYADVGAPIQARGIYCNSDEIGPKEVPVWCNIRYKVFAAAYDTLLLGNKRQTEVICAVIINRLLLAVSVQQSTSHCHPAHVWQHLLDPPCIGLYSTSFGSTWTDTKTITHNSTAMVGHVKIDMQHSIMPSLSLTYCNLFVKSISFWTIVAGTFVPSTLFTVVYDDNKTKHNTWAPQAFGVSAPHPYLYWGAESQRGQSPTMTYSYEIKSSLAPG